jgi:hypothetical protein
MTIFKVIDAENSEEQNFYDAQLPQALAWAKDCKRQMKSLTGRDYAIVVQTETETLSLKEYENSLG